jgi:hypothetical protein
MAETAPSLGFRAATHHARQTARALTIDNPLRSHLLALADEIESLEADMNRPAQAARRPVGSPQTLRNFSRWACRLLAPAKKSPS